jgi:hypothetical protein
VLYFAASNVSTCVRAWGHLSNDAPFYIIFSLLTLTRDGGERSRLDIGKWLHNLGAIAMWIPAVIVIVMVGSHGTAWLGERVHAHHDAEHSLQGHYFLVLVGVRLRGM